jgi:hypothetical protein
MRPPAAAYRFAGDRVREAGHCVVPRGFEDDAVSFDEGEGLCRRHAFDRLARSGPWVR